MIETARHAQVIAPLNVAVVDQERFGLVEKLSHQLPKSCLVLDATPAESRVAQVRNADVLVTEEWLPQAVDASRLKLVQLLSVGFEHLETTILNSLSCPVSHASGASAVPVAEWCMGMMLYFAHRIEKILEHQRNRSWHTDRVREMTASALRGQVVGIVGYGAIGREVARLCHSFGMTVHASTSRAGQQQSSTYLTPNTGDPEGLLPAHWFSIDELPVAIGAMDYLVLGLRVTDQTRHLVDERLLSHCKRGLVLINPARGALVDERAIIRALQSGQLGGAALDAFEFEPLPADSPLWEAPHVVVSPHCSPESSFFRAELISCVAENIRRLMDNRPLLNVIVRD